MFIHEISMPEESPTTPECSHGCRGRLFNCANTILLIQRFASSIVSPADVRGVHD